MKDNTRRNELIDSIIKSHMLWSLGAGIIPVPLVDFLAVGAIQIDMVRQISRAYDIDYKESEGKTLITALTGASFARLGASAVKSVPGIGSFLGGATMAILSGASTYAVGEVFKKHFETGGTFLDFDLVRLKKYYDDKFEKGKKVAKDMHKKESAKRKTAKQNKSKKDETIKEEPQESVSELRDDIVERLRELAQLKEAGIINDAEYDKLKTKLIG